MVNIATGLGLNYLLNTDDNLTDIINFLNCIIKEPDQRYNQFVFDASVSIGFDYSISGKLMLTADLENVIGLNRFHQPYSLGSNADIDINSRICSLGLEIGLKYKLK